LGVDHSTDADIQEVKQDVDPCAVLEAIEQQSQHSRSL
jgi:hypothetical protein